MSLKYERHHARQMAQGIDVAQTVGVFITNRYIDKALNQTRNPKPETRNPKPEIRNPEPGNRIQASGEGEAGVNDNCKFEVW